MKIMNRRLVRHYAYRLDMRYILLPLFCVAVARGFQSSSVSKLVYTKQGPVRGYKDPLGVFAFHGIPYATAPVGIHKFKAPLPPRKWLEPLEAVDERIACPQIPDKDVTPYVVEQEQCLIANVFVPDIEASNLTVMIQVHGGGGISLYSNFFTPKHLVKSQNIIAVTFNYRLGLHGFLCLGTEGAPGNAGLKDQVAALRWVKDNISAFGGNPNDVTLSGYSSGAIFVDLLSLSPAAAGLYNKIIVDSSVSLIAPGVNGDPMGNAKTYASFLGFNDTEDKLALDKFYTTTAFEKLLKGDSAYRLFLRKDSTLFFSPCVELKTYGREINVITEPPIITLKRDTYPARQVPILYSFYILEGMFRKDDFFTWKAEMNDNFTDFLPGDLKFKNNDEKAAIAKRVKNLYFGSKPVGEKDILKYLDYFSDTMFINQLFRVVKLHLKAGHDQVFLYEYSYKANEDWIIPYTDNVRRGRHCEQAAAVYDGRYCHQINSTQRYRHANNMTLEQNEDNLSPGLKQMKSIIREIVGNFVKTGTPVPLGSDLPPWPPVRPGLAPYMEMTLPPRLRWQWNEQMLARMRLWDDIYGHYYRLPIPPQVTGIKRNSTCNINDRLHLLISDLSQSRANGFCYL